MGLRTKKGEIKEMQKLGVGRVLKQNFLEICLGWVGQKTILRSYGQNQNGLIILTDTFQLQITSFLISNWRFNKIQELLFHWLKFQFLKFKKWLLIIFNK